MKTYQQTAKPKTVARCVRPATAQSPGDGPTAFRPESKRRDALVRAAGVLSSPDLDTDTAWHVQILLARGGETLLARAFERLGLALRLNRRLPQFERALSLTVAKRLEEIGQ